MFRSNARFVLVLNAAQLTHDARTEPTLCTDNNSLLKRARPLFFTSVAEWENHANLSLLLSLLSEQRQIKSSTHGKLVKRRPKHEKTNIM